MWNNLGNSITASSTIHPHHQRRRSNHNPLHLIQRDLVARAIVELRRPGRFVRGDRLGVLDRAAVFEIRRDPSCPERVAAGGGGESGSNLRRNRPN